MNNLLHNKKVLIIGGSSGIGLAVAKQVYKMGASLAVASRSASEKHNILADAVGDGSIETFSFDITSENETRNLFQKVSSFDHLVITVRPEMKFDLFEQTDIVQAKKAFDTKFWGQYQLIQKVRSLISKTGSITMTTGIAGEKIYKKFSTMSIINSATETLCRYLAVELAPIRVNVVSPGYIEPKAKEIEEYALSFPMKRLGLLEEIASAYVYLATSSYVTGTTLVADGGARLI